MHEYRYAVTGEEMLSTVLGELSTIRVERIRSSKDRQTISWFAPKLGFIPVQVKQIEDGQDSAEMRIRTLQQ